MARVGLSRPKAFHGLEIVGHGIETSKYNALGSVYANTYDVRTSRSASFELEGHGRPRNIIDLSIDTEKVSQHKFMPRMDQGALVAFEALAIPMGLLERGGALSTNMPATQRTVSPEWLGSLAWGESPELENGVRPEVSEFFDATQESAKIETKTGLVSSSLQGNVSSDRPKSTMPNKFPAELKVNHAQREAVCGENKKPSPQKCQPSGYITELKCDISNNNNLLPIWNRHYAFSAKRDRNQSPGFRGRCVYKNPWSTFGCHSDAAETFREVVTPMNSSFPVRQSQKSAQSPRPFSSIVLNSPSQKPHHGSTHRSAFGLLKQRSSCHRTLFVVGHSNNSHQINTQPVTTTEVVEALFQRTAATESGVAFGQRCVKFSSKSYGRISQRSERKIEALSGDCVNKCLTDRAINECCTSHATDAGIVTNGYTALKRSPPKSKSATTSPTSPSYPALEHSQLMPQHSDSPHDDQNAVRMTLKSGSQPQRSRTASRTSFEKSNGTCGKKLSEEKILKGSKSDSIQISFNGNQVVCDTHVNRAIVVPISLKVNGFSNPDEDRNKVSTASDTKVERCRNGMASSAVQMENTENQLEHFRTSSENSKIPMKNSTDIISNSTAAVENTNVSGTALENSKVSFINKVTVCLSPTQGAPFKVTSRPLLRSTQVRSVNSPESCFNVSDDISSEPTCNNSSYNNNEELTSERKHCNNHLSETQSHKSDSLSPIAEKDGHYFLSLVAQVESDMKTHCVEMEQFLEGVIPDEASGRIRAAIGKANLLMTKKFKQFRELCNNNLTQSHEEQFQTTSEDLTGYWDLVQLQVDEIHRLFQDIHSLHSNNWIDSEPLTVTVPMSPKATEVRPKEQATQSAKKLKSSKAGEASKAREESRKRLMAAKMAGRQRKASETEEEIQIFIS